MTRLACRTASSDASIWLYPSEEIFRRHLVELEKCTNAVPIDTQTFPLQRDEDEADYTLPFKVEQQLADDLAFLAAIEEGAQSVAAVCLEEHLCPARLTIRFAALDLALSGEVKTALQSITDTMSSIQHSHDMKVASEALFDQIVKLHYRRLIARLRSDKWEKPKYLSKQHKKPLWQDFSNLVHRVQFLYTKKEVATRRSVEAHLQSLAPIYEAFEESEAGSLTESGCLKELIKASYALCKAREVQEFARRLEESPSTTPTPKVASAIKCLRQIEKIASYWRIAMSLAQSSQTYPSLYHERLTLAFLTPYKSVPTTIGYETWATSCHVHAEVQLAVYYDLQSQSPPGKDDKIKSSRTASSNAGFLRPRAIGTSKWLCYLCYLFLRCHGCFVPANTHGRLYDQWTIPDLAEYGNELRARYSNIIHAMDEKVLAETKGTGEADEPGIVRWRPEPMTSRQNLLSID